MTTPGLWPPPTLALDVSGDETKAESRAPRYCHSHGLFSLFSSPTLSRRLGGNEHERAAPAGQAHPDAVVCLLLVFGVVGFIGLIIVSTGGFLL